MEIINSISPYVSILALIGTYCLIVAYDRSKMPERLRKRGQVAEATVTEILRNPGPLFSSQEGEGYAPVVEFEAHGSIQRHTSTNYQQPSPHQVGQKVVVRYYFYKSIREVLIDGDEASTASPKLLVWGICLCLVGYPFIIIKLMDLI